jgi:hypothetical protein
MKWRMEHKSGDGSTTCSGRQARLSLKAGVSARLFGSQGLTFLGTKPLLKAPRVLGL